MVREDVNACDFYLSDKLYINSTIRVSFIEKLKICEYFRAINDCLYKSTSCKVYIKLIKAKMNI